MEDEPAGVGDIARRVVKRAEGGRLVWYRAKADPDFWHDYFLAGFSSELIARYRSRRLDKDGLGRILARWVPKDGKVLEAGSGAGYWLAVLVTFALGTAAGDWTIELTGWSPGEAILLPAGLIAAVFLAWRLGAGPVLSFWLAYVLTRPLGANLGDYLGSSRADGGLGLGTLGTSVLFLAVILAAVVYLTVTGRDRTERVGTTGRSEAW